MPYAQQVMRSRMDQITAAAGSSAVLQIVTATSPETILATFNLNNPIAGPATGVEGILTLSGFPKTVTASGTGTAALARIRTGGSVLVVSGMTVGTTSAHDVELSTLSFNTGQNVTLNSATIQHASIALPPPPAAGIVCGTNLQGMEPLLLWNGYTPEVGETLSTLQDTFDSISAAKWTETNDAGCDSTIASAQLSQGIHATNNGYTNLTSKMRSTLLGAEVFVKLVQPVQGTFSGAGVETTFQVISALNVLHKVFFNCTSSGDLAMEYNLGAGNVTVTSVTYNSTNHKWLKIRETGGTIFFETAPEGGAWTVLGSLATSVITWNLADCQVVFASGRWQAQGTASGAALFDGLNTSVNALIAPWGTASPGRFNGFTYNNVNQIAPRDEAIATLASHTLQQHRLPIRWELLQPILVSSNASLATRNAYSPAISTNGALYTNYRDRITSVLDAHAAAGSRCILALKGGCRYTDFVYDANGNVTNLVPGNAAFQPYTTSGQGVQRVFGGVGSSALSQGDFNDLWSRIAAFWGNNWNGTGLPHPGLGGYSLMDEAYDLGGSPESLTLWPTYATGAIAGIRSFDPTTPIYICGNAHSYASNWNTVNPSFPLAGTNLIYEARQYLDFPGTGVGYDWTHESANGATTNTGLNGVTVFGNWLATIASGKGAISDIGLPLDGTSDANQANWNTAFLNVVNYCRPRNIEIYTSGGGSHWKTQGAPYTHHGQFYQSRYYEPLVGGLIKNSFSTAKASLFDSGPGYWDPAAGGGGGNANNIDYLELHRKPCIAAGPTAGLLPVPTAPLQPTGLSTFTTAQLNTILGAGTTVSVPNGIYIITSSINVVNNHNISAANDRQVIFRADPSFTGSIISEVSTNFTISGILLDGNYASRLGQEGVATASLIHVQGCAITVNNCVLQNSPGYGIWSYNAPSAPQITNNEFYECWQPIRFDGNNVAGAGGLIEGNKFLNTAALKSIQGVETINCKSPTIRLNAMKGIGFQEPTSHPFEGAWGNALFIYNTDAPLVEENTTYQNYWSGLVFGQNCTNGTCRNNYFQDGTFTIATHAAWFEQVGCNNHLVEGNYFDGAVLVGDTGGNNMTIINNIFRSRTVGLDVSFACKIARIEGNDFRSKAVSQPFNNGLLLWDKTDSVPGNINIQIYNNHIQGFVRAIDISQPGNSGQCYGIKTYGNNFVNNTTNGVFFEGSITQTIPVPVTQTQQKIQAESGTLAGTLATSTAIASYEGSGYVRHFNGSGDQLTVNFTSVEKGRYHLRTRYANNADAINRITVAGATTSYTFTNTSNAWATTDSNQFTLTTGGTVPAIVLGNVSTSLTITVGARGNLTSNVVLAVSSDAGGSLTGTPVTLIAGANPTATFTFQPAGANLVSTLTYSITSGAQAGMSAPPPRVIYSHSDPVAFAATNLAIGGRALLAKLGASLWEASKGYTDYYNGGALSSSAGNVIRAICDSSYGSTYKSPMDMLVFGNMDNNYGGHAQPTKGIDTSGKHYALFDNNVTFPLWCRKSAPIPNINPVPYNKMPFHLADTHFMVATCMLETTAGSGTVMQASNSEVAGNLSQITIDSSRVPRAIIGPSTITGSALNVGQAYTLSLVAKTGANGQRLRIDNAEVGTPGSANLQTSYKFNQILLGGGYNNNAMAFSNKMRIYAAAAGFGDPTTNEITTVERLVASLGSALGGGGGGGTGPGIPFGSRVDGAYPYGGTITSRTNTQMDNTLKAQYTAWKAARVRTGIPASPGDAQFPAVPTGKYIKFSDSQPNIAYVSEGIGYGMLLAAIFAGHDPDAKALFDGLLTTARARHAYNIVVFGGSYGQYLMNWRMGANGEVEDDTAAGKWGGGGWNAMDGDQDMAQALLMAHRQWGSTGTWNYLQEALNTINAIKQWNMKPDGTTKGLPNANCSRVSDYMFDQFRSWKQYTGDTLWDLAVSRCFFLANRMQTVYSASAGLVPDFIMGTDTASPFPSTGGFGNGDGNFDADKYWYNACRCPWRWATDYLLYGNSNTLTLVNRINAFFHGVTSSGATITNIRPGYFLDGTPASSDPFPGRVFVAPVMCGAMCNTGSYQTLANNAWIWNESNLTTGYYDAELQLLSMVVASGNWWKP